MINKIIFIFICLLGFSYASNPILEDAHYYSANEIIKYADYLTQQNKFSMARTEYQRALFILDNQTDQFKLVLKIGTCYYYENQFDFAISEFKKVADNTIDKTLSEEALYLISVSYFKNKNYSLAKESSLINRTIIKSNQINIKNEALIAAIYILEYNWEDALQTINNSVLEDSEIGERLRQIADNPKPKKNLWLAAILSSLVPGAGKVYAKNSGDALFSFISVTSSGLLALWELQEGTLTSPRFITLSSLYTIMYLGNIYGSYIAGKFYNQNLIDDLHNKINQLIEI